MSHEGSEHVLSLTATRFAPRTLAGLVQLLVARRSSISRCVEALCDEAVDALCEGDRNNMFADEDPAAAAALMLAVRAGWRPWEVEQALARMRDGAYGYCVGFGAGTPLERQRAVHATATCVACSGGSPRRTMKRLGVKRTEATMARRRSWARSGTSVPRAGE